MKTRVVQMIPTLGSGGAERLVMDIVRYIDHSEFEVSLVSLYSKEQTAEIYRTFCSDHNIPIYYLNKKPGFDLRMLYKLVALFRKLKPHAVHTHLYAGIYAVIPNLCCCIPVRLHTIHNVAERELPAMHRKIMRWAYHHSGTHPIAISPQVKKTIQEQYALPSKKIPLICNGIDTMLYQREKKIVESLETRYICVARFSPQKNHARLIEAFASVKSQIANAKLYLVGGGELEDQICAQVNQLGLQESVILTGETSDVKQYLSSCDVFVMASDYEGLPLSMLEAMAMNLPVVSTKAGGVVDIVTHGVEGYLVDIGDVQALAANMITLQDRTLRELLGANARKRAEKYDIRCMVKRYERIYRSQK